MRWRRCLPLTLTALMLGGCGTPAPTGPGASRDRIRVVTTILPVTLFTRAVAGDCAVVTALIPPGSSPHAFQARPADLLSLRRARVLVINGLEMESFLERLIRAAEAPDLRVIDSSRGVTPIRLAATAGEPHHHDDHGGRAAGSEHRRGVDNSRDLADRRDHSERLAEDNSPGRVNPHIWLDPQRAVQQVEAIRDGLIQADARCAPGYRQRAAAYIGRLHQLDRDITARLKPYRGRSFVAFHDVAPYFAQRYGLNAAFLVDVPEVNPTPRDLRRVAALVQRSQLRALLSEPQQGERSFNALARDLGIRLISFDPLESADERATADPDTYLTVMHRNAESMAQAFGPAPTTGSPPLGRPAP